MADRKLGPYNTDAIAGYRVYPVPGYILIYIIYTYWLVRSQSSHFRDTTLELSLNGGHSLLASPCSIGAQKRWWSTKKIRFLSKNNQLLLISIHLTAKLLWTSSLWCRLFFLHLNSGHILPANVCTHWWRNKCTTFNGWFIIINWIRFIYNIYNIVWLINYIYICVCICLCMYMCIFINLQYCVSLLLSFSPKQLTVLSTEWTLSWTPSGRSGLTYWMW